MARERFRTSASVLDPPHLPGLVLAVAVVVAALAAAGCGQTYCPAGQVLCNSTCVDVTRSNGQVITTSGATLDNCGACGTSYGLPANATTISCASGTPHVGVDGGDGCKEGFADCDDQFANGCEANLNTDPKNCGTCGNAP